MSVTNIVLISLDKQMSYEWKPTYTEKTLTITFITNVFQIQNAN